MDTKKERKGEHKYICKICDYYTSDKTKFSNHCQTIKHTLSVNDTKMIQKKREKEKTYNQKTVCNCGKSYAYSSGLFRHKKICKFVPLEQTTEELKEVVKTLICKNTELIEQNTELFGIIQNSIVPVQNIQNIQNQVNQIKVKNTFNIQIFLNEKCKNAISLTDFVESIQPSLTDLEKVGRLGYVEGISSIILSKLKTLDIYTRPIHCSDLKRETLYVKDQDWEKDNNKVDKMVKTVALKNMTSINQWRSCHPKHDDMKSDENNKYLKLVKECVGGDNEYANTKRIIKNISKDVLVKNHEFVTCDYEMYPVKSN